MSNTATDVLTYRLDATFQNRKPSLEGVTGIPREELSVSFLCNGELTGGKISRALRIAPSYKVSAGLYSTIHK